MNLPVWGNLEKSQIDSEIKLKKLKTNEKNHATPGLGKPK